MEERQMTPLRFGIMVDDLTMEAWKVDTIRKLLEGGMSLALVIRNAECVKKKSLFKRLKDYPFSRGFFQTWNHYMFKPKQKALVELEPVMKQTGVNFKDIPKLDCLPIHQGISTYILDNDIQTIKNHKLDFIIRFGFDIIKGDILNAAKYGVWSFHHDDEMEYRGGPPGFWEWMEDNPRNGIILQRLTESLDNGYVLKKRWYPTILHSYKSHLDMLLSESTEMPLQVCREIQQTGVLNEHLSESKAVVRHPPRNFKMLKYWMLCISRRWRFHWHELFRQEDWNVGYLEMPLKEFLKAPADHEKEVKWFDRKRRSSYYADPFVITSADDTYIFFENYDYRKGKGRIEVVRKTEQYSKPKVALEEPFHLSYPFVFEHESVIYCIPESHNTEQLLLYRFDETELKMVRDCVLMDHVKAIDPTLIHKDGQWNLFFTKKDYPSVKLYRFISEDLKGPYLPFFGNPVKVDCADARMAGSFFGIDGNLLRPAQECVRYYGTGVGLNRMQAFTDTQFEEVLVNKIHPFSHSEYKQGFHTLNGNDTITVFDGKRWTFTFSGMTRQLKDKMKKRHV